MASSRAQDLVSSVVGWAKKLGSELEIGSQADVGVARKCLEWDKTGLLYYIGELEANQRTTFDSIGALNVFGKIMQDYITGHGQVASPKKPGSNTEDDCPPHCQCQDFYPMIERRMEKLEERVTAYNREACASDVRLTRSWGAIRDRLDRVERWLERRANWRDAK